ncbi:uncharacterized protein AMSG_01200 [Thecamonas trahens ATCC 50062]|uniref:Uncharacterized protein n=1 Tax=Thecamonas trahens ATCC 50062 TaxID=461836 RepID=A0A0L0DN91_THETB|nr:hypothetical protein AMSG_01200 [Thecamonas trahens ATCC 50062]KNC53486.1 hypothetical protein AMSG_01200 [Thecamonas trahens ATCC 50062]|eukprot:XP_013761808.1 hypothetical protein AMSG_01200 [Thecamonas trahens ATCC 50062]
MANPPLHPAVASLVPCHGRLALSAPVPLLGARDVAAIRAAAEPSSAPGTAPEIAPGTAPVTELAIAYAGIDSRAVRSLLPLPMVLVSLALPDNCLGPAGGVAVADAVALAPALTALDLAGNGLGDHGLSALLTALRVSDTLVDVCASRNRGSADLLPEMMAVAGLDSPLARLEWVDNGLAAASAGPALAAAATPAAECGTIRRVPPATVAGPDVAGEIVVELADDAAHAPIGTLVVCDKPRSALVASKLHQYLASSAVVSLLGPEAAAEVLAAAGDAVTAECVLAVATPFLALDSYLETGCQPGFPLEPPGAIASGIVAAVAVLAERGVAHLRLTPSAFARYELGWRIRHLRFATLEGTPLASGNLATVYASPGVLAAAVGGARSVVASKDAMLWQLGMVLFHLLAPDAFEAMVEAVSGAPVMFVQSLASDAVQGVAGLPYAALPLRWRATVMGLLALEPSRRELVTPVVH